jgi:multidrug efflux pump subunit AcrA (membrane-fusion protein)
MADPKWQIAFGEDAKFSERFVKLGAARGEFIEVLQGLVPGDRVVTHGSFFLRVEAMCNRS